MFARYGAFVARRAKLILVLAGVVVAIAAGVGFGAFGKLQSGGFDDPASASSRAAAVVNAKYGGASNLVLLARAKSGTVDSPDAKAAGVELSQRLASEPGVDNVVSYWATQAPGLRSTDGTEALILSHVEGNPTTVLARSNDLIKAYATDGVTLSVVAGGDAATNHDVNSAVTRSLAIAEAIAVPLTMLLLILAFESLVAAALPLVIGTVAIFGTFAELFVLGSATDVSIFAVNLTTALGLGLGIDYALLIVGRYREELARGVEPADAVARTVQTAGRTIVFSALTVAAALAALLIFPLYFLRSFAYAGIGVVAIAAVAALLIAPAMLAVLGHRVNAGKLPWSRGVRGPESPLWGRIAAAVFRRPALAALPVIALLLVAASPLLHVSFGTPDAGVLPKTAQSRVVSEAVNRDFAGNNVAAIDVVIDSPVSAGALADYATRLSTLDGVVQVRSSAGTFVAGAPGPADPANAALARPDAQRLSVVSSLTTKSSAAQALVNEVRAVPGPDGHETLVGGEDARFVDTRHAIGSRLPAAVLFIILTTMIVLFLFTGSLIQPIRALVLGALSLAATLGVMTWIFQDGHLSGVLGFTPRPMDTSMTVLLFCIAFGLSMDYEVFLTSRIKELHDNGANPADATVTGLARTGRIVSTAAGLLAVSFVAFGTSSVSFLQLFGLGTALAIVIDATLVRAVLVPVVMRLFGTRIWYAPAPLRRVHTRLALSEG